VDEAILTGESVPVEKGRAPVAEDALPADQRSMLFSGTLVAAGRVSGVVTATGVKTEIGRIGRMVSGVEGVTTPLLRQIDQFGRQLSLAIVAAAVVVFGVGWQIRSMDPTDAFMAVVALAVAAIPEGLPAILTITLALGVQRMASRNAIVRRLPAVETLGSVNVICTDKTGTLTRNEMAVEQVLLPDGVLQIRGEGYEAAGEVLDAEGEPVRNPGEDPGFRRSAASPSSVTRPRFG
jgi:P-type E1-E2 ATPase